MSDNLAGEVGTPIWRNVLTLSRLRQIYTIPIPARWYVFFIGPGGYYLLQYADNQHYQSFITRQVVRNFRNAAPEHINIVKRRKPL